MAFRLKAEEEPIEMQLSSMVDIVFLMLIYFIVAATVKQEESELKVSIPIDPEVQQEEKIDTPEEVVIDVFETGDVYWNGQITDTAESDAMPELKSVLADLKSAYPDQAVVVRGQRASLHKRVVAVLNACAFAGIDQISFPSDATVFE
jgi:biopolymer transport protein ExbD